MPYLYNSSKPFGLTDVRAPKPDTASGKTLAAYRLAVVDAEKARILADAEPESNTLRAVADAKAAERDTLAAKAKAGFKFVPADDSSVVRYAVDDAELAEFLAADAKGRKTFLAAREGSVQGSPVHPSIAVYEAMRAAFAERTPKGERSAAFLAELASGVLVIPTVARGKSASAKAAKRDAATVAAEAAAAMFASFDADDDADDATEVAVGV